MTRHGLPPDQLLRDLARMRQHGIAFEDAWDRAWSRVRWPHSTEDRRGWKAILLASKHVWQAAYNRQGEAPASHAAAGSLAA